MSTNGGRAPGAAFPADYNIVWLPGIARRNAPAPHQAANENPLSARSGMPGWALHALAAAGVVALQAAALPALAVAGSGDHPWTASAAFGMAAAAASWAGARMTGAVAPRAVPQDLALHDSFTLALILAASAVLGNTGAFLLLPAGMALSLMARRIGRKAAGQQDLILALLLAVSLAGVCGPFHAKAWAIAGVALAVAVLVRMRQRCLRTRQMWHIWGTSAVLCAAIAFVGQERGLPAAQGVHLLASLAAGAIYGAAAWAGALLFSRRAALAVAAAVPFLAAGAAFALADGAQLTQLAAALLLAGAVAGSRRYATARREPIGAVPNAWPAG